MFPTFLLTAALAAAPSTPALDSLLAAHPADSLMLPLRRFESEHARDPGGAAAAEVLGELHYARGEYLLAAGAFTRAGARLDPRYKDEARYWAGMSWLAQGELQQARAALEEVAAASPTWRADALYAIALVWEAQDRVDHAYETLGRLLAESPGEVGPAALERMAALAERLERLRDVEKARERLHREYPESIEAARTPWPGEAPGEPSGFGAVAVQIGVFSSAARARTLLEAARAAGFSGAQMVERGQGTSRVHVVRVGVYPNAKEARKAGDQAADKLGVTYILASPS